MISKFEKHYIMQGAQIWLPNATSKDFLCLEGRLLESAEEQRNVESYNTAEFFSRRLRENERTLVTLTLRIEEALSNEVEVISDLNELAFIMNKLSRNFDRIVEDLECFTFTTPSSPKRSGNSRISLNNNLKASLQFLLNRKASMYRSPLWTKALESIHGQVVNKHILICKRTHFCFRLLHLQYIIISSSSPGEPANVPLYWVVVLSRVVCH